MASQTPAPAEDPPIEIAEFQSKRAKRSDVWSHCGFLKEGVVINKSVTVCKICQTKMPYTGNTTTMRSHLDRHHYDAVHPSSSSHGSTNAATATGMTGMFRFQLFTLFSSPP